MNSPTTGSCLLVGCSRYSGNVACVGVRSDCIVGVAEVGVGYAVLLPNVLVLSCGVAVGVDVGKGTEVDVAFGMPKP